MNVCLCAHESRCPQSQRCSISGVAVTVTGLLDAGSQTVVWESSAHSFLLNLSPPRPRLFDLIRVLTQIF